MPDDDAMNTAYAEQFKALDNSDVLALFANSENTVKEILKHYEMQASR